MKIGGLIAVKDYKNTCSSIPSLKALCDFLIVLDKGSTTPFPFANECDEYIYHQSSKAAGGVEDAIMLMYRAYVNRCDWVVQMEDDMVFSSNFTSRKDVTEIIRKMEKSGHDTCQFVRRQLWDSASQYRDAGKMYQKTFPAIKQNWFYYPEIMLPANSPGTEEQLCPDNKPESATLLEDYIAYHCEVTPTRQPLEAASPLFCLTAVSKKDRVHIEARFRKSIIPVKPPF